MKNFCRLVLPLFLLTNCTTAGDKTQKDKNMFVIFDKNKDGYLNFKEFYEINFALENKRALFLCADYNHDGLLAREELEKHFCIID